MAYAPLASRYAVALAMAHSVIFSISSLLLLAIAKLNCPPSTSATVALIAESAPMEHTNYYQ